MKKFAITLLVLVAVALPVFAAAINGAIDLDGSKAAKNAAILKSWEEAEKAAEAAKKADVVIGEITVTTPEVVVEEKAPVKKAVKVSKTSSPQVCRTEILATGGEVQFCASKKFMESLSDDQG